MGNPGRMFIRSGSDGKDLMTEKKKLSVFPLKREKF